MVWSPEDVRKLSLVTWMSTWCSWFFIKGVCSRSSCMLSSKLGQTLNCLALFNSTSKWTLWQVAPRWPTRTESAKSLQADMPAQPTLIETTNVQDFIWIVDAWPNLHVWAERDKKGLDLSNIEAKLSCCKPCKSPCKSSWVLAWLLSCWSSWWLSWSWASSTWDTIVHVLSVTAHTLGKSELVLTNRGSPPSKYVPGCSNTRLHDVKPTHNSKLVFSSIVVIVVENKQNTPTCAVRKTIELLSCCHFTRIFRPFLFHIFVSNKHYFSRSWSSSNTNPKAAKRTNIYLLYCHCLLLPCVT